MKRDPKVKLCECDEDVRLCQKCGHVLDVSRKEITPGYDREYVECRYCGYFERG